MKTTGSGLKDGKSGSNAGFTIVEIMVVVAVIGILCVIAVPMYSKIRNEARGREAMSELQLLHSAIRQLAWDTGKWPGAIAREAAQSAEIWDLSTADAGLLENDGDFTGWKGPYIRNIKEDPWGNKYFFDPDYEVDGVDHVVVGSFGPNGEGPNNYDDDDLYVIIKKGS